MPLRGRLCPPMECRAPPNAMGRPSVAASPSVARNSRSSLPSSARGENGLPGNRRGIEPARVIQHEGRRRARAGPPPARGRRAARPRARRCLREIGGGRRTLGKRTHGRVRELSPVQAAAGFSRGRCAINNIVTAFSRSPVVSGRVLFSSHLLCCEHFLLYAPHGIGPGALAETSWLMRAVKNAWAKIAHPRVAGVRGISRLRSGGEGNWRDRCR